MSKGFNFSAIDFLVGTKQMTDEEVGRYIRILSTMSIDGRMTEKKIEDDFGVITDRIRTKFKIDSKKLWYNVRLETELKKEAKQPMTEEESRDYKECMKLYFTWFEQKVGMPPQVQAQDGIALKKLCAYFRWTIKKKNLDDKPVDSLKLIFENWSKIDPFMQSQLKISQIFSNFNNIINQLKNGGIQRKQSKLDGYKTAHERIMQGLSSGNPDSNETV